MIIIINVTSIAILRFTMYGFAYLWPELGGNSGSCSYKVDCTDRRFNSQLLPIKWLGAFPWSDGGPTLGLGASGKWMMATIIHLPEGSTQPAVYMIQLGGKSPWSLQWGDQPYVMLC